MKNLKRSILLMLFLFSSMASYAYDLDINGFYYDVDLDNMTATLVGTESKMTGVITIPETITYRERVFSIIAIKGAFSGHTELEGVSIPNSVTILGPNTFEGCISLTSVSGMDNITELGTSCFHGCEKIESLSFSDNLQEVGAFAFRNCSGLSNLVIPESVATIGEGAFKDCKGLVSVKLPQAILFLPKGLFSGCESLQDFEIPVSVKLIEDDVFSGCSSIEAITIPSAVKDIYQGVFRNCTNLKTVVFEAGSILNVWWNRDIGTSMNRDRTPLFEDCPIETAVINRTINSSSIDSKSYLGCFAKTGIKSITLSRNVNAIEEGAFRECANLSSIIVPNSVVKIGTFAFSGSGIESVIFEDGQDDLAFDLKVPSWSIITPTAFADTNIEEAYIGRNFTIGSKSQNPTYKGNPVTFFPITVTCFTIGDYVKNIDLLLYNKQRTTSSLSHYPNLTKIELGGRLIRIPDLSENALLETLSLTATTPLPCGSFTNVQYMNLAVEVPTGSLNAYQTTDVWKMFWNIREESSLLHVFEVDGLLYKRVAENSIELIKKDSEYTGTIIIPEEAIYNGKSFTVVSISERAFEGCTSLNAVQMPNTIETIGDYAFYKCSSLSELSSSDALYKVGEYAFYDCSSLKSFIGKNVSTVGNRAFNRCSNLKEVVLSDKISTIPEYCFNGCYELTSISSLDNVTTIGETAFWACEGLNEISLPSITYIAGSAFAYCANLKKVSLGDELEEIFSAAFSNSKSLESITIPGSVKIIWHNVFSGCSSLKEIIFADGDTPLEFNTNTFDLRTDIWQKQVNGKTVSFKIEYYKSDFSGIPVEKIYLGRNLSGAPRHTITYDERNKYWLITSYDTPLNDLPNLKELIIGENVDVIGPSRVYFPEVDLEVTPGAFKRCESLQKVVIGNSIPPSGAEFTNGTYSNAYLIVPANSLSAYQEADVWRNFLNIMEQQIVPGDANGDGVVSTDDVTFTANYILGLTEKPISTSNADLNADGRISVGDMTIIIKKICQGR